MPGHLLLQHVGKNLPNNQTWRRLIKKWETVLNQYLKDEDGYDIPQWHIERSHTGFLAAAVWKMGGVALEEYSAERRIRKPRRRHKTPASGRCDLFLDVENLDCVVEAKHKWVSKYSPKNVEKISNLLGKAGEQLKSLPHKERAETGISLCWVVPELKGGKENSDDILEKIAKEFITQNSIVAVYHVPSKERKNFESQYGEGRTYPGVVLVGRQQWP